MTISRRLKGLATLGLLRRLAKTNPAFYEIARGQEALVRKVVYFKHTEDLLEL
jgi:hypothetical protein